MRGSFQLYFKVSTLTSFELGNRFWIHLNLVHANNNGVNWYTVQENIYYKYLFKPPFFVLSYFSISQFLQFYITRDIVRQISTQIMLKIHAFKGVILLFFCVFFKVTLYDRFRN